MSRRTCLSTILPWIEHERSQINLPDRMIRLRLAEVQGWLGDVLLNAGEARQAQVHLRESLRQWPWQPRTFKLLAMAYLPDVVRQPLRRLARSLKVRPGMRKGQRIAAAEAP